MSRDEIIEFIKDNMKSIYDNFKTTFDITIEEFEKIIINFILSFDYNASLRKKDISKEIFSVESLNALRDTLREYGIKDKQIKSVIIKSPIILIYDKELERIHYIYKKDKYIGYTIVEDDEYNTYLYNENIDSNLVSNNYIADQIIKYKNIDKDKLTDFIKAEENYKLKNYYYKKKQDDERIIKMSEEDIQKLKKYHYGNKGDNTVKVTNENLQKIKKQDNNKTEEIKGE